MIVGRPLRLPSLRPAGEAPALQHPDYRPKNNMSVIGIGVNVIECSRIQRSIERFGDRSPASRVHRG